MSERLVVRVSTRVRVLIEKAAGESEMTPSEWVRGALEQQAVRERPRVLGATRTPSGLCLHPLTARKTLPHEIQCVLCGETVKALT